MKIKGFVETINKRRRIFDYDNANGMVKASFLRESINTLFQGSSADIIKKAMLEIDIFITEELENVNMLLQIHDELIFEIPNSDVDIVSKRFKDIMETIIELRVPLECSVSVGDSWGELK
jgi:DNA polymerase-1